MGNAILNKIKDIINLFLLPRVYLSLNFVILITLLGYYFLSYPIVALDTDLWYHLSGGRYFFTQGNIPQTSFFSFLEPIREYVNYYWLFQILTYKVFSFGNYYGLIILKTVIFFSTSILIFFLLLDKQNDNRNYFFLISVFCLFIFFLIPRAQLIRPHIFSYFFIVLFLYVFELSKSRPLLIFILPPSAVLWCNIHGIEYHVLLLISFSYLTEYFINLLKRREKIQYNHLSYIIPVILTIAAVYATPHGSKLLGVPLISTHFASEYIPELRPILHDLFSLQVNASGMPWSTITNLLVLLSSAIFLISTWRKKIRISHAILMLGGIFLLSKGSRFGYEFSLLSLPLLRSNAIIIPAVDEQNRLKKRWALLFLLILLLLVLTMMNFFKTPPKYPFSTSRLPEGVVTFLNSIPAEGKVVNHPFWGGYLQWKLFPKYRILMDMQVPFVFRDEDYYSAGLSFKNPEALSRIIKQYDPSFILAPIDNNGIGRIIHQHPLYKLVFFDHLAVLYIREDHYPNIVKKHEIRNINPFDIAGKKIDSIKNYGEAGLTEDLLKILRIYPECLTANHMMAMHYLSEGKNDKAMELADVIINNYPEMAAGYVLKGDALKRLTRYDEAIENYNHALDRCRENKKEIYKSIGYVYAAKKDNRNAYLFLKKGINIFSPETTYQELWDLSTVALLSGKTDESYTLLQFASRIIPADDIEFSRKVKERLEHFPELK